MKTALIRILLASVSFAIAGCQSGAVSIAGEPGMVVQSIYQPEEFQVAAEAWPTARYEDAPADDLAVWLMPDRAAKIVDVRKRHTIGTHNSVARFYEASRVNDAGVCQLAVHSVVVFLAPRDQEMVRAPSSQGYTEERYRSPELDGSCPSASEYVEGFTAVSADAAAHYLRAFSAAQSGRSGGHRPSCEKGEACAPSLRQLSAGDIQQAGPCVDAPDCLDFTVLGFDQRTVPRSWSVRLFGRNYSAIDINPTPPGPPF